MILKILTAAMIYRDYSTGTSFPSHHQLFFIFQQRFLLFFAKKYAIRLMRTLSNS
jgi:hypothetical protein